MDGSQQPQSRPQSQANLIRPEQVARLPQLNPAQKQSYEQGVKKLWDVINTTPTNEPKYQDALNRLVQTSHQLMAGMKAWQQRKAMAQQSQAAQGQAQAQIQAQMQSQAQGPKMMQQPNQGQVAANTQGQGLGGTTVHFNQLLPEIQRRVNEQHFHYPPAMVKGTEAAEVWLREAKARLGQAYQRLQIAKNKKAGFQQQVQARQAQGTPLTAEETAIFNNKLQQCDRAILESTSFMKKFNEQQEQFKSTTPQQQHQFSKQATLGGSEGTDNAAAQHLQSAGVQGQGPTAHSISSAVSAARNQASANNQTTSPTAPAGPNAMAMAQQTPISASQAQFPGGGGLGDTSAAPRPVSHQGPPALQHSASSNMHPHPLNSSVNGIKTTAPHITKNLQVPDPKAVPMPASRPTLNGGAGVGLPGQLAQPAITALPGYVLESSEDGRVLSKKKLNELVREVCGPGPEEQLDPEAEEVRPSAPSSIHIH
jgi:transcription initiation factor TFIID subunit 12